ncbi:GH3 domain-containing protein [Corythoichthys intestinalis]|uniref:GH3 domain-containing protein n=1 Tax=Corythoichthys intestinalis TaxID=161448 RepID=UPI0025A4E675|nr:GH3 domain-containing protein [Corythoichthys intestinalis]XP_061807122.1 GH3 domain-containing protein-like [Nerophis lumbriciformis]
MSSFQTAMLLFFAVTSAIVAVLFQAGAMPPSSAVAAAVGVGSLVGASLLWRDVRSKVRGEGRALGSLLGQYLAMKAVGWLGRRQRSKLEADTLDVRTVQEETLLSRLRKNENTLYGKRFDFGSIKDSDTFRARHPITTYQHYRELVSRVASGEDGVLTAEKPLVLAMTSGTSGPSAMLLSTKDTNSDFFLQGVAVCLDAMQRAFPATDSLQRTTKFFYTPTFRQSQAGIPIGPNSSTPASSRHMLHLYTTPAAAFKVKNEKDVLYLHLLFALRDPSVGTLESNFASSVFYAFTTLQERWEELIEDVERGTVSAALNLEPDIRAELEALSRPDPERASQVRACFRDSFRGIAGRLWPRLNLILAVDSGSNQIYGEMLKENYCNGIPFYSPFYAATEGLIGVNLWPDEPQRRYLLCPRSMFCEFLPENQLEEETEEGTFLMEEVKEGQNYELVVTNAAGLYRYRIGDVVKVTGFHNRCPVVEFQYRRGQMLNVRGEKVTEALFLDALKKAVSQWPAAQLLDYCCAESGIMGDSIGGCDPHYQVFLELKGVRNLSEEQRYKLDECLQQASAVYRSFRIKGSIGPTRVQLVAPGAFAELRERMMSSSLTSANTFKMQRVLRRKEDAQFLLGKTVS